MKYLCGLLAAFLLLPGCSRPEAKSLGAPVSGPVVSVAALGQSAPGSVVAVHGTMTRKCPVAGCWFFLQDATGTIKVDTKNAGFVVVEVPLHTALTVAGIMTTNDGERVLEASGLRY